MPDSAALFINGRWLSGKGDYLISYNPSTGEQVWKKRQADQPQSEHAMVIARQASAIWSQQPESYRIEIIQTFIQLLQQQKESLAILLSRENGKPLWEARTEIDACIGKAQLSIKAKQQRCNNSHNGEQQLHFQAIGTVLVIGPYNFPFHLPNGHILPALLAGNCVVFKPSEYTPACAEAMVRLWQQSGLPDGVLQLIPGDKDVSEVLIKQAPDAVLFTGSSQTGIAIHQALAGKPEVLLALEMGGNNPLIIDQPKQQYTTKQREKICDLIIRSAFISSGQRCTCSRRLIVLECEQNRELLPYLLQRCQQLNVGNTNGEEKDIFIGPLISAAAKEQAITAYQSLLELGASPLLPPALNNKNTLMTPTLVDVSRLAADKRPDKEIFAPLLQLIWVDSLQQAIEVANDTRYGLAAGLVSDNTLHQQLFQQQLRAGFLVINKPTTGAPGSLPFGGQGISGNYRPSGFFAADYCAWPQARCFADEISESVSISQVSA